MVLLGVVVVVFPPHQPLLDFLVVVVDSLAGVTVDLVVVFLTFSILQVHVGDAVPSLHILKPVVLLQDATPPCPEQHAAYAPANGVPSKNRMAIRLIVHLEAKLSFFI